LIKELGIGTVEDFNKLAREQGLGSFGKDREATKFLNQLLTKAGKPNYSTVAPIQRAVEKELFPGSPQKTKMDRMVFTTRMEKISNAVQSMKKPLEEKVQYIRNMIKSYYPTITSKSLQSMLKLFSMSMGPSMIGADMMSEGANKEAMSKIFGGTQSYAGGGIASMDDIIRPIGYDIGGIVPKEKPSPDIKPKEKPVNFKAIMAEFDTPEAKAGQREPTGIEKIIADEFAVDPRFTMKQRIKEMLGMGGDQGSGLMDEASNFEILNMKLKLLRAADSLAEMDRIQTLNPYEILEEFTAMENKK
jgi:hypothetical protein